MGNESCWCNFKIGGRIPTVPKFIIHLKGRTMKKCPNCNSLFKSRYNTCSQQYKLNLQQTQKIIKYNQNPNHCKECLNTLVGMLQEENPVNGILMG